MSISNIKRVFNEVDIIISSNEKTVGETYYIVDLHIDLPRDEIIKLAKFFLHEREGHQPLSVYAFSGNIKILFPPNHEGEKYHLLISEYVSKTYINSETKNNVMCQILEMKSQKDVLMYFTWVVHTNEQISIVRESNGIITKNDVLNKTRSEIFDILESNLIDWEDIKPHDKYGTFYKIKYSKKKYAITSISENIDYRESKKYTSFLFESTN